MNNQLKKRILLGLSCPSTIIFVSMVLLSDVVSATVVAKSWQTAQKLEEKTHPDHVAPAKAFEEATQLYQQGTPESKRQAIAKFKEAMVLLEALGDPRPLSGIKLTIGRIYLELGEDRQAENYFNESLSLIDEIGNSTEKLTTLNYISNIYEQVGNKQKTLEYLQKALPVYQELDNPTQNAYFFNQLALLSHQVGEIPQALEYLKQALSSSQLADNNIPDNRRKKAEILYNLGTTYLSLGDKQQALEYSQQALVLLREQNNRVQEAATLNNLGSVYWSTGEMKQAIEYYHLALDIYAQEKNLKSQAVTLNNLGSVYWATGEQQKALDMYEKALSVHRQVDDGDREGEAAVLHNLGTVYEALGEKKKAIEYLQLSLPLHERGQNPAAASVTLSAIGTMLGKSEEALEYFEKALSLTRETGKRSQEAVTLHSIGYFYDRVGKSEEALEYYNQALPIRKEVGDRSGLASTLNNMAKIYSDLGDNLQAIEYYNQALQLNQTVGNRRGEATTNFNLAFIERKKGNLDKSLDRIESAIAIVEQLRTKIDSAELRSSYFATVQDYYKFYIDLLMELHKQNPKQSFDAKALHASESSRARTLLELLTEANANIRQGVDPKLLQQEQTTLQKLDTTEKRRIELVSGDHTPQQLEKIKLEYATLQTEYKQLQNQIKQNSPRYAALKYPQPLNLQQIQKQVLDDNTILLEYSLGADRSYLWAVTKNSITSYQLPPQAEIETAAQQFIDLLTAPHLRSSPQDLPNAAKALSEIILQPVAPQLKNKRLLIVSDGILQYIPFSALSAPGKNIPLIVEHKIVNLPSASTIAITRNETANRKPAPKTIAILADPVFEADDERIQGKAKSNNSDETVDLLRGKKMTRAARGGSVNWKRLPGTRIEAEAIVAQIPDQTQRTYAIDFSASREKATSEDLNQYKFIHFATHGFLNATQPELSGIVMSLVDKNGNLQNGFLYLQDVFNLKLSAELVVLSACETGLGEEVKGEGIVGLTRGFMYAGAPRVVVSLWKVNDEATAKLMSLFYEKMLVEKMKPVEALRAAQIEMLNSPKWQDAEYWAAFTLQGEWQ
ncbi:MAG: CHAT domain-containing tetratricopeptide repeat protein [Microcoleaceae cyanobacterium]